MPFDPSHLVDIPPFSVRLDFEMKTGGRYTGTGFCVDHQGRSWLVTCRHNVEDRECAFTGANDLSMMSLGGERALMLGEERRVVAIRVNGFIPDCAAIELFPGEWQATPKFDSGITMTMEGLALPEVIEVRAPPPSIGSASIPAQGFVLFQGFPGDVSAPVTVRGARIAPLPTIIQPWMKSFLPACEKGFSGGPVLDVTESAVRLFGVTTHYFQAEFSVSMGDGRRAEIGLPASAFVPIAPLLWALERASPGNSVVTTPIELFA
ncbi:MAG: hypothetical protein U1C74_08140 [Phenylobacterium sp.]|nr:hypothetical protein [Phenylobacterium sp.]